MTQYDSEAINFVLRNVRDNDVKFIRLWFSDIVGNLKGVAITSEELESAMTRGMGVDGFLFPIETGCENFPAGCFPFPARRNT